MKSNLFRSIEGQTHLGTSWHVKMSWTLNEPIQNVLRSNLHTTYLQASTIKKYTKHGRYFMQNHKLPIESHGELEDNSSF